MSDMTWELTHSEETNAGLAFAWSYWTNVANWDDPPAKFELDGPFAAGSHGITRLPDQKPFDWLIVETAPPSTATIELQLEGAVLCFEWRFEALTDQRTLLTQRVVLRGENAAAFRSQIESTFTSNLAGGMKKLARAIARAEVRARQVGAKERRA
jgi:hypothetical protein